MIRKETNVSELKDRETRSRAEVLYCLDVLIRHIVDEDVMETWLTDGVPDGTLEKRPADEQVEPFLCYAEDESSFNDIVWAAMKLLRCEVMEPGMRPLYYVKGSFA